MSVVQIKPRRIDQHRRVLLGRNIEAPEDGLGKGLLDSASLVGVIGDGAVGVVRLDEQYLWAAALELYDPSTAYLPPVQSDIIRADSGGE